MNKRALTAVTILVAMVVLILNFAPSSPTVGFVKLGDQAKPFKVSDLQGNMQGLPKGEVVILNFWATWCPPCRKEIPSMVALYDKFKDKGLHIVAVAEDSNVGVVKDFVQEQSMAFTVLHETDKVVAYQYGVFRYPETFIIDKQGVVRQHLKGEVDWMSAEYMTYVEGLLAEPLVQ